MERNDSSWAMNPQTNTSIEKRHHVLWDDKLLWSSREFLVLVYNDEIKKKYLLLLVPAGQVDNDITHS